MVLDLARGPDAAEPWARVSALQVLAHQVGGAVGVALALLWVRRILSITCITKLQSMSVTMTPVSTVTLTS